MFNVTFKQDLNECIFCLSKLVNSYGIRCMQRLWVFHNFGYNSSHYRCFRDRHLKSFFFVFLRNYLNSSFVLQEKVWNKNTSAFLVFLFENNWSYVFQCSLDFLSCLPFFVSENRITLWKNNSRNKESVWSEFFYFNSKREYCL